jgi:hypothetical protein
MTNRNDAAVAEALGGVTTATLLTVPTWNSIPDGRAAKPHVGKLPDVLYRCRSLTGVSVDCRSLVFC